MISSSARRMSPLDALELEEREAFSHTSVREVSGKGRGLFLTRGCFRAGLVIADYGDLQIRRLDSTLKAGVWRDYLVWLPPHICEKMSLPKPHNNFIALPIASSLAESYSRRDFALFSNHPSGGAVENGKLELQVHQGELGPVLKIKVRLIRHVDASVKRVEVSSSYGRHFGGVILKMEAAKKAARRAAAERGPCVIKRVRVYKCRKCSQMLTSKQLLPHRKKR